MRLGNKSGFDQLLVILFHFAARTRRCVLRIWRGKVWLDKNPRRLGFEAFLILPGFRHSRCCLDSSVWSGLVCLMILKRNLATAEEMHKLGDRQQIQFIDSAYAVLHTGGLYTKKNPLTDQEHCHLPDNFHLCVVSSCSEAAL